MPIAECIVCGIDMPEHREGYATCSHDCLVAYRIDKWRAQRRNNISYRTKGHAYHKPPNFKIKIGVAESVSRGKYKHSCDYCKTEFMASNSKVHYCSPQCSILGRNDGTYSNSARRIPSMPKMPWDK